MNRKIKIYNELLRLIEQNIQSARLAMDTAIESKNNETKSSAGDKFETSRAMMQAEQDRYQIQWQKAVELKNRLRQIDVAKSHDRVEIGSLVHTNHGTYFISVGLGKVIVDAEIYYAISLNSPLGKQMLERKNTDRFNFQQREFIIYTID